MAEFFNRSERSDKQEDALTALRTHFTEKYLTIPETVEENAAFLIDETYIRYLKARNWNVDKATAMLEATVKWRKEFEVDALTKGKWHENMCEENASGKLYVRGLDKSGNVLVYMKPRNENSRDHDNNVRHLVYNLERALAYQKFHHGNAAIVKSETAAVEHTEASHKPNKICLVVDYEGFTLANSPPFKTSRAVLSILQDHYPERLHRAYLIRTPWVFSTVWKLISPFVDPVSKAKIVFMKSSDTAYICSQLEADIDPSVLEADIGGQDSRPFNSSIFMDGPFHTDFLTALEARSELLSAMDSGKAAAPATGLAIEDAPVEQPAMN
jgi:hypothetical protein